MIIQTNQISYKKNKTEKEPLSVIDDREDTKSIYDTYPFWKFYKDFLQNREKYDEFISLRPAPRTGK